MQLTQDQAEYLRKQHVHICIPCYGGQMFESAAMGLIKFTIYATKLGMNFSLDTMVNESLITRGRNSLVAKAMSNPDATHLMFVDSDIGFEGEHILQLLLHDRDIVGGFYPKKSLPIDYVVNVDPACVNEQGQVSALDGLIPLTRTGTGFMLIKRAAISRMFEAYPQTKYRNNIGLDASYDQHMYALFDTMITREQEYCSEDWTFCDRWRAIGGEIWGDPSIRLNHTGHFCYPGDPTKLAHLGMGQAKVAASFGETSAEHIQATDENRIAK